MHMPPNLRPKNSEQSAPKSETRPWAQLEQQLANAPHETKHQFDARILERCSIGTDIYSRHSDT